MARREGRGARREDSAKPVRKGSGLFTGLLIGLTLGLAGAAGVVWYLNMTPSPLKEKSPPAPPPPKAEQPSLATAEEPAGPTPQPSPAPVAKPPATKAEAKPQPAPKAASAPPPRPKVNYTFYGILPGDKPARPMESPAAKDTWWLQIAALSDAKKADQIRAKLVMLNLRASIQKIESNGQPLYRIRVGPYKREDDAFADLDVLTENDFNARLLKDPVQPQ
jgi:DedD protein